MKIGECRIIQIWITTFKKLLKQSGGCKVIKINHDFLIEKQNSINSSEKRLPFDLNVKVRRALSWIRQAEKAENSYPDNCFLFYWIAFNALYSSRVEEKGSRSAERLVHQKFFDKLLDADKKQRIYNTIWGRFQKQFKSLIGNKYLFLDFWKYHNNDLVEVHWGGQYQERIKRFDELIRRNEKAEALAEVFASLYVLRNQIAHGGSTWGSDHNTNQVEICSNIIKSIVPLMVDIMLESPDNDWGELHFPVLDKKDNRLGDNSPESVLEAEYRQFPTVFQDSGDLTSEENLSQTDTGLVGMFKRLISGIGKRK